MPSHLHDAPAAVLRLKPAYSYFPSQPGNLQVRGLAHKHHWLGPLGGFFERFGAVKASPLAAYKLLRDGHAVLLFPGGAAEVRSQPCCCGCPCWCMLCQEQLSVEGCLCRLT